MIELFKNILFCISLLPTQNGSSSPFSPLKAMNRFFKQITTTTTTKPFTSPFHLKSHKPFSSIPPLTPQDFTFLQNPTTPKPSNFSSDAISIAKAIDSTPNNTQWEETQRVLRNYREKLDVGLVSNVLKIVKNRELGVKFFIWAGRQVGYTHGAAVYHAVIEMVGGGDRRVPEGVLREIREGDDGDEVLGELMNVLVRKCCRNGKWGLALEELGRLKDFGYKASRATYNVLVRVFLEADRVDSARLVHDEMVGNEVRMDEGVLGCFVYRLCKSGEWRDALELIEKEEVDVNAELWMKMIMGLSEASLFDEAMEFLGRMRCGSCIPNVDTYQVLVRECLRKERLGMCKRILGMMMAEGCYPDRHMFSSIVHGFCKAGEFSYAYKFLQKMEGYGRRLGYVVYNIMIGGICGRKELPTSDEFELAEKVYGEMLDAGILLNKINISNFARCLCGAEKFEKAYKVIQEMMSKGFVPDATTYSNVIEILCNSSRIEKAFLLFEEMRRNRVVPDVYIYSILIDAFCKAGLIEQAQKWFTEMIEGGCSPNVVTYTSLIHAYLKARKLGDADKLFERMLSQNCIPNIVTYTALIDGHCKGGNIDKACHVYERMMGKVSVPHVDMYFGQNNSGTNEPNVFTYGALIDGLCKSQKVSEARDLLDAMLTNGCEPNRIVYDALIDGFCKEGKLDEAQEVFTKMSSRGYSLGEHTYGSLIDRMFKDKRLDLALKFVSKMLESSCAPNVVIYTEMIDGLCKVQKTEEAYKLLLLMDEKGCRPNVVSYTALIDGFGKAGKVDRCLELFKVMGEKGCVPNYITYRVLINHCCSAGLLDDAYSLLEEMKQMYWPLHAASYQKVIDGFSREFLISNGLLDAIGEKDSVPLVPAYRILIDSLTKAGRLETALQLYKEIASSSQKCVAGSTCSLLIKSLCLASKVEEGFDIFADNLKRGGTCELDVFFHLILGLTKLGQWDEALQLSHSICYMVNHMNVK